MSLAVFLAGGEIRLRFLYEAAVRVRSLSLFFQALVAAERAAEQARQAQTEYEQHVEAERETKRATAERRAETERLVAEAAREEERRHQAELQRQAALRRPRVVDCTRRRAAMKDWPLFL